MFKKYKTMNLALLSALVVIMLPEVSFAGATEFENALCSLRNLFTGKVGTAIATLAVIFLGVSAFFGKVTWGLALMIAVGIAAIFGADAIVKMVSSGGATAC